MPVISLSGGLDSCVLLADTLTKYKKSEIRTITFIYDQPALFRELEAVNSILQFYDLPPTEVVDIPLLPRIKIPPLPSGLPKVTILTHDENEKRAIRRHSFLPFRNFVFMSLAAVHCYYLEQYDLFFGFTLPNGEFPDADENFVEKSNQILLCTVVDGKPVRVQAPLINLQKTDVIRLGATLGAPMHLTFSCFTAGPKHCGTCPNCFFRKKSFGEVGLIDQVEYLS